SQRRPKNTKSTVTKITTPRSSHSRGRLRASHRLRASFRSRRSIAWLSKFASETCGKVIISGPSNLSTTLPSSRSSAYCRVRPPSLACAKPADGVPGEGDVVVVEAEHHAVGELAVAREHEDATGIRRRVRRAGREGVAPDPDPLTLRECRM